MGCKKYKNLLKKYKFEDIICLLRRQGVVMDSGMKTYLEKCVII